MLGLYYYYFFTQGTGILFYNRDYSIIVFQFIINPLHTSTFFFLNQKYPFSVIADTNSLNVITT
jgi:hypothetical protein